MKLSSEIRVSNVVSFLKILISTKMLLTHVYHIDFKVAVAQPAKACAPNRNPISTIPPVDVPGQHNYFFPKHRA